VLSSPPATLQSETLETLPGCLGKKQLTPLRGPHALFSGVEKEHETDEDIEKHENGDKVEGRMY